MGAAGHVNVTVVAGQVRRDLRLPVAITVARLVRELAQVIPGLGQDLRRYQLLVGAKGLLLGEQDVIGDFPVTDGDLIELV